MMPCGCYTTRSGSRYPVCEQATTINSQILARIHERADLGLAGDDAYRAGLRWFDQHFAPGEHNKG